MVVVLAPAVLAVLDDGVFRRMTRIWKGCMLVLPAPRTRGSVHVHATAQLDPSRLVVLCFGIAVEVSNKQWLGVRKRGILVADG